MPRKPSINPSIAIEVSLPPDLKTRLDSHLYSPSESRIPFGAYKTFFSRLLADYFAGQSLEILPGQIVRGSPQAIQALRTLLKV